MALTYCTQLLLSPLQVEQQLGRFQLKPTSGGGGIGPRPWGISIPSSSASTNTGDLLQVGGRGEVSCAANVQRCMMIMCVCVRRG